MRKLCLLILTSFSAYATEITPHPENHPVNSQGEVAIACMFQQEGPWLKEWIEFHRLIGVNHFYLYNNLSKDSYLEILEPYIRNGVVELFDYPAEFFKLEDQLAVYSHALERAKADYIPWLALIDADEYITPMETDSLIDLLAEYADHAGVYLLWQIFGTSGIEQIKTDELMIEKLTLKIPEDDFANHWGKTLVQTQYARKPSNAHWFSFTPERRCKIVPLHKARINHYLVRTEAYLREVKLPRLQKFQEMGRENMFTPSKLLQFLSLSPFVVDHSMERFIIPLKIRMNFK